MFSVPLFRQVTLPGRYPAHCPVEFGLSSRLRPEGATAGKPDLPGLPGRSVRSTRRPAVVWLTATFDYRMRFRP